MLKPEARHEMFIKGAKETKKADLHKTKNIQ
jgi:hypothetical protein